MRPIALLTDFGLNDAYVGQLKAVVASLAPNAPVLDLCHAIRPFDVAQAALYLEASWRFFPPDTIFVAVVDPGVGTRRRLVILEQEGRLFLAPDNGLLAMVVKGGKSSGLWDVSTLVEGAEVGATFHGRDVLAPLAARLAMGQSPDKEGRCLALRELCVPDWVEARRDGSGIIARIVHVDRFGNCLLNLRLRQWPGSVLAGIRMRSPLSCAVTLAHAYADIPASGIGLVAGSQGFWELAVNQGSAAKALGAGPGVEVVLEGISP